jgi:hypothetical protein
MEEPIQNLIDKYEELGKDVPDFLKPMADMLEKMELKPAVFENLDSAINILKALHNSAYITQESFDALTRRVTRFAVVMLDVKGNLNEAMKEMDLTNDQIQQLLPSISQFIGTATMFGLQVPAWMKTFVTEQLGVNWKDFQETAKAQANSGIATVEKLESLLEQNKQQKELERWGQERMMSGFDKTTRGINNGIWTAKNNIVSALMSVKEAITGSNGNTGNGGGDDGGNGPTIRAQTGWEGIITKPTQPFIAHKGEHVKVTPAGESQSINVNIKPLYIPKGGPNGEDVIKFVVEEIGKFEKRITRGDVPIPVRSVGG